MGARWWDTPAIPALALAAAPGKLGPACSCLAAVFWHEHQKNMESQGDGDAAPAFVGFHAHRPRLTVFCPLNPLHFRAFSTVLRMTEPGINHRFGTAQLHGAII